MTRPMYAHGYCHTCSRPLTRVEGRDQSHVHDGTEIILGKLDTAPLSALVDQKTESDPFKGYHGPNADDGTQIISKIYMSVDRNFRVTIHEGNEE